MEDIVINGRVMNGNHNIVEREDEFSVFLIAL